METYKECLSKATKRHIKGDLKLCPRGYCTAKQKFEVYPSAYANGYAVSVCKGNKPDYEGLLANNYGTQTKPKVSDLDRWYREQWVNVCKKGKGPGGYAVCGSGKGIDKPEDYPYCRPYYKLDGTPVQSVNELTPDELAKMCKAKKSRKQGIKGKPTRVYLKNQLGAGAEPGAGPYGDPDAIKIPENVRKAAQLGLKMRAAGFKGGTQTGWNRAQQLTGKTIDLDSLADMRTWFARHGPDASNGGTSYPGYLQWIEDGSPMYGNFNSRKGAVSWLIWGGDPAYKWLKSTNIRNQLEKSFPSRKTASLQNNLKVS